MNTLNSDTINPSPAEHDDESGAQKLGLEYYCRNQESKAEEKSLLWLPAGALAANLVHAGDAAFPTMLKEPSTASACR